MTVQRISFEDRGQDFLWWEIQVETGRVVGCGPFQGWVWASGKTSVDMATIAVGARPLYFSPHTGADGSLLNYPVIAIAPAKSGGGGMASLSELNQLINLIDIKVDSARAKARTVTQHGGRVGADYVTDHDAYHAAGLVIAALLEAEHGARFRTDREPMTMTLAGLKVSCTGGHFGLFSNWQNAARRRLAQMEAK